MKTFITFVCAVSMLASLGFGQNITYIGFEGAVTSDVYEIFDPCETITSTRLITGSWGFSIGQQVHKNLLIESGFIWKYYDEGYEDLYYEYPLGPGAGIASSFYAYQIPLRLISRINLKQDKLYLNTIVGYHFGINRDYGNDYVYSPDELPMAGLPYYVVGNDTIKHAMAVEDRYLRKNFGLIEAGLGLEYVLVKSFIVGLSASYFVGLDNVILNTMSTGISNGITTCTSDSAIGVTKGSYSNLRLTLKYDIGKLWRKDEKGR